MARCRPANPPDEFHENSPVCDGRHIALARSTPHDHSERNEASNKKEAQLMYWNKIATYAVDSIALASAMIIAIPFALVISAPFLGAF